MPTLTAERTAAFMPAAGAPTFNTATLKLLCGHKNHHYKSRKNVTSCWLSSTVFGNTCWACSGQYRAAQHGVCNTASALHWCSVWTACFGAAAAGSHSLRQGWTSHPAAGSQVSSDITAQQSNTEPPVPLWSLFIILGNTANKGCTETGVNSLLITGYHDYNVPYLPLNRKEKWSTHLCQDQTTWI